MTPSCTILVPARDASRTIDRAISSAVAQGEFPILLVDDWSSDDTVARARAIAGDRLRVVRPAEHTTVGAAHDVGLRNVHTDYCVLLDADDELMPGRADRLVGLLDWSGADIAADAVELVDGTSGRATARLPVPDFLLALRRPVRLFERNYLPSLGQMAYRTSTVRAVGYDGSFHGGEDIDLALRALRADLRFALTAEVGYRMWTFPDSVTRNRPRQRAMYRRALEKHPYEAVRRLYREEGLGETLAAWALASMALFREDYVFAQRFVTEASAPRCDDAQPLEPDGPFRRSERWRRAFFRGTVALLLGSPGEALPALRECERLEPTAEGANNLGIACARGGEPASMSRRWFEAAWERFPGYADAWENLHAAVPSAITSHPLRQDPARCDYPVDAR